jgi:hypothetical protein
LLGIPDPGNDWRSLLENIPEPPGGSYYIVGGWVRDLFLLGPRGIRSDIDIVTPEGLTRWAQSVTGVFGSELRIEPDFLTARTVIEFGGLGRVRIDMSQFRKEVYDYPGALPRVFPGSREDDLIRRDFTMNAIMLEWSVSKKRFIRIFDPFEGRKDLKQSSIRLVRPGSLTEDPTRLLRLVRVSVRLGLRYAESLQKEVDGALSDHLWDSVGPARIAREFERLLQEPDPLAVLNSLSDSGILENLTGVRGLSPSRRLRMRRWNLFRAAVLHSHAGSERERHVFFQEMFFLGLFFGMSRRQFSKMTGRLGLGERLKSQVGRCLFDVSGWPFQGFYYGFEKNGEGDEGRMQGIADGLSFSQVLLLSLLAPEHDLPFWNRYIEIDRWTPPLLRGEELVRFSEIPPRQRGGILLEIRMMQRTGKLLDRNDALEWLSQRISEGFP